MGFSCGSTQLNPIPTLILPLKGRKHFTAHVQSVLTALRITRPPPSLPSLPSHPSLPSPLRMPPMLQRIRIQDPIDGFLSHLGQAALLYHTIHATQSFDRFA